MPHSNNNKPKNQIQSHSQNQSQQFSRVAGLKGQSFGQIDLESKKRLQQSFTSDCLQRENVNQQSSNIGENDSQQA
eukprot:CAMPEP_0117434836 /NCGR_PEP_ID=MMETSP0759-20121206/159_1 /TAXON_ID=63605 /ORGANISM="Percolomonas cosmopolitus, Strain WS" /LENGTH=75 /DNA_ID=CAMNT_0005226341 /DNA_START=8 /DNA_END=235 /DNA_ORIENTATION=+